MFKFNSHNTIILFAPRSRGNFVRCSLTLAPGTADAAFQMSTMQYRLDTYMENTKVPVSQNYPWGPGHMDAYKNFDVKRLDDAEPADRYVHCAHLLQIPKTHNGHDMVECVPLARKKFVVITITENDRDEIESRLHIKKGDELDFFTDLDTIDAFFPEREWYQLPYKDITSKTAFLDHCLRIDPTCHIDLIEKYYEIYHKHCI